MSARDDYPILGQRPHQWHSTMCDEIDHLRAENAKLAEHPVAEYPHELWCPSIDVCAICADSECDGIGCISDLNPNNTDDQPHLEQLQAWVRLGRIQEQANAFLVVVENRS